MEMQMATLDQFCANRSVDSNSQILKCLINLHESLKRYDIIACSSSFLQILCKFMIIKVRYFKYYDTCRLSSKSLELVY
jgi:hypothetical protein